MELLTVFNYFKELHVLNVYLSSLLLFQNCGLVL